ncbi:hypothetical protein NMG60_11033259 [Bertholletia excelsa]
MEGGDNLELIDFTDETNFEQFFDLIQGESNVPMVKFYANYESEHVSGCLDDQHNQFAGDYDLFGFSNGVATPNPSSELQTLLMSSGDAKGGDGEDDIEEEESSAITTPTNATTAARKADRSRTLISERRRRGRMKDNLYALRALVPNITKMDKASIVGDAVLYVQDLKMQAKKLRAEIAGLEKSKVGGEGHQKAAPKSRNPNFQLASSNQPIFKTIMQMDIFQVEDRGFYVRVECSRGPGVAPSLYKALESLTRFNVQSSNLAATLEDGFVLTFTLKVGESEPNMNLPNLKLWVTGALLNQGFAFLNQPCS